MQTCRRRQPRYSLQGTPAFVEFSYPEEGGRAFRLAVADVGASGLGFLTDEDLPGLELGTTLRHAVFCYGDRRVAMDLLVLHVTQHFAGDVTCGCLIYPASDEDLIRFKEILGELALQPGRAGAPATS
jgi:hypothetical protein